MAAVPLRRAAPTGSWNGSDPRAGSDVAARLSEARISSLQRTSTASCRSPRTSRTVMDPFGASDAPGRLVEACNLAGPLRGAGREEVVHPPVVDARLFAEPPHHRGHAVLEEIVAEVAHDLPVLFGQDRDRFGRRERRRPRLHHRHVISSEGVAGLSDLAVAEFVVEVETGAVRPPA